MSYLVSSILSLKVAEEKYALFGMEVEERLLHTVRGENLYNELTEGRVLYS